MTRPSKKKLFIEATPLLGENPSGVAKLLYGMIDALCDNIEFKNEYEVHLIIPIKKKPLLNKWNLDKDVCIDIIPLPLRLVNLLDKLHIMFPLDVYFGKGTYLFPNYRRLPLLFSRSLTYVHDAAYALHPDTVVAINRVFLERVIPISFKKSDLIITLSEQSRSELQKLFPQYQDKIKIIPCGIDTQKYHPSTDRAVAAKLLSELGVRDNEYILFVGNIEPRKNIGYLLDIFVELVDSKAVSVDTALLIVGGGGWNNERLMIRIDSLNKSGYSIILPKKRITDDQLPILYSKSLVSTLMSIHEGFGMTPLEALASGSRVVVSDIPVLREVGGEVLSYAALDDKNRAVQAFKRAIGRTVSRDAIRNKLGMFTWKKSASILIGIIDNINNTELKASREKL